jgi:HEAT repeat protein
MSAFDWKGLLQQWTDYLLASPAADELPADVRDANWLGTPAATDGQIASAEQRLGIPLPPSYRAFLKVSNGWDRLSHPIRRLWRTDEIQWFKKGHRDWIAAYTVPSLYGPRWEVPDAEYFSYDNPMDFKPNHLKETLQISEVGDSEVFLLNPQVIDQEGEWEAWFFANWLPGVHRFRSFRELMESDYHSVTHREWRQPVGLMGELPDEYVGAPGTPKRHLKKRRRRQAVKVLNKPVDQWDFDELVGLLKNDSWTLREEVAWGRGKLKDPRAIEPLLSVLADNSNVCGAAMYALRRLAPERLPEPLLDLLRRRHALGWMAAAHVLAELGEPRAVPILVEMAKDTSPKWRVDSHVAAKLLAEYRAAGFDALADLLATGSPAVRDRAVTSLSHSKDPRAIPLLRELLSDPDHNIREHAAFGLQVLKAPRVPHQPG